MSEIPLQLFFFFLNLEGSGAPKHSQATPELGEPQKQEQDGKSSLWALLRVLIVLHIPCAAPEDPHPALFPSLSIRELLTTNPG